MFVHVLLYDLFVYRLYLKSLPSFNLNSSPLSRDHVFFMYCIYRSFVQWPYDLLQIKVSFFHVRIKIKYEIPSYIGSLTSVTTSRSGAQSIYLISSQYNQNHGPINHRLTTAL